MEFPDFFEVDLHDSLTARDEFDAPGDFIFDPLSDQLPFEIDAASSFAPQLEKQAEDSEPVLQESLENDCQVIDVDVDEPYVGISESSSCKSQTCELQTPEPPPPPPHLVQVEMPESTLVIPRSCYEPFDPGVPTFSEASAVKLLLFVRGELGMRRGDAGFVEIRLDDFAVYCESTLHSGEMRSLNHLDTKRNHSRSFFDGRLSVGGTSIYVHGVPIKALPIGSYGDLVKKTVRDDIWIQSFMNFRKDVYYKLGRPAKEYERFFNPFLWVADLAKHFVDFMHTMGANNRSVTIYHFRSIFRQWIIKVHRESPVFLRWLAHHPSHDFRTSIVANVAFLYKEAIGVLGYAKTHFHTIWSEIWDFSRYKEIPRGRNPHTVVTQYIYDCFAHLPFGNQLEAVQLSEQTQKLRDSVIRKRHLEMPRSPHRGLKDLSTVDRDQISDIKVGDTISTQRDSEESGTKWRREMSLGAEDENRWFALVQRVHVNHRGRRKFDVIWYYQPVDTLCGLMKYPWKNELFLSDHCSCGDTCKIAEDEVLGVHDVDFGGSSATASEFFCRLTYVHAERKWISLEQRHKHCSHLAIHPDMTPKYRGGDTVLVHLDRNSTTAEPCEVMDVSENAGNHVFQLRRLLRRQQVDPEAAAARPNELVYTDRHCVAKEAQILSPCHVRFFYHGEDIPTPYNRDGVGGMFYITHRQVTNIPGAEAQCLPLDAFPTSLRQGFDPAVEAPKLRGLDLFCGGGNFGRGLEDGGGIEMKWVNDFDSKAIHTYMANVPDPEAVSPFLGSVDDLQRQAISGRFARSVPTVGAVDFISAGSPCPGFSNLTNDKTTAAQRKNQSLVAAFGSFVDLYRPRYALLENVPGIVQKRANRDQDVFSQLVCALVGLGYQAQFFFLDASSCGASQRRSRVFVVCAAPGHALPRMPLQTHAHPPHTKTLGIGHLPNGESMAERVMPTATAFGFVSAQAATADLPPVYDAKPDLCIPYPDHRITIGMSKTVRTRTKLIPNRPWGINFAQAWYGADRKKPGSGPLTPAERLAFPQQSSSNGDGGGGGPLLGRSLPNSNAYGRQFARRPFDTIVTHQSVDDAKTGRQLHWREPRVLTVMEARRAQGFRDGEVLLGLPAAQWRIVGNSVAREVAVALGVVFREAWLGGGDGLRGVETVTAAAAERDVDQAEAPGCYRIEETLSGGESYADDTPGRRSVGPLLEIGISTTSPFLLDTRKRPLQSTPAVDIFASKLPKLKEETSPGYVQPLLASDRT